MTNLPEQAEHGKPCYCDKCTLAEYARDYRDNNPLEPDDERHGTVNGYINHKCRCQPCKDSWAPYHAEYITRYRKAAIPDEDHGQYSTYLNRACRCQECKDANAAYARDYRARKAQGKATSR